MNELGIALRELARVVVPASPADPVALWTQGRRRIRRQRLIAASASVVVAAILGLAALLVPAPAVVMPAGEPHPPAIPANIYVPDPDLAGTAEEGPPGRLAVLGTAERDYHRDFVASNSIFGISAATGEYRFLDLPDQVLETPVAMSPDGRRVAYWIPGPTSGKPYLRNFDPGRTDDFIGGLAIYDTEDGSVIRAPFESAHGLSESIPLWVDSKTVVFEVWPMTTRTAARKSGTYLWPGGGAPRLATSNVADVSTLQRNRDGSFLVSRQSGGYDGIVAVKDGFFHFPGGRLTFSEQVGQGEATYNTVSRSGGLVAVVPLDVKGAYSPLMAGTIKAGGQVESLRRIGELQNVRMLGWRDDHTVLAAGSESGRGVQLVTADLRTGAVRRIGTVDSAYLASGARLLVATDLTDAPMVHGRRPPEPQGRPWIPVVLAAGVLTAGAVLLLVRRRRG